MTRSPDNQIPSAVEQSAGEKRYEQAFMCRQEGEDLRAATEVNAVSASLTPPAIMPIQLELFPHSFSPAAIAVRSQLSRALRCAGRGSIPRGCGPSAQTTPNPFCEV
jgi:hypothetical protein